MQVGSQRYLVHGGIHRIPLPGCRGGLFAAGFSVVGAAPGAALDDVGARTLVCLMEHHELVRRFPEFVDWLADPAPHRAVHRPVPDHGVIGDDEMVELVGEVTSMLAAGERVLVHCGAGWGRTGVLAALVLVQLGEAPDTVVATVRAARPAAGPQSPEQIGQLERLGRLLARR